MNKTLVLLAAFVAFSVTQVTAQQYYNISPKYIYEHQTMDSTHVGVVSADTIWFNKTASTKDVNLYRSSANRLRTGDSLTVDGNLTVTGTSTHTGVASFANGTAALPSIAGINDPNTGMRFPGTDTLAFSTGGSERMRIDPSGFVGIGTTGPGAKLDVSVTTAGTASIARIYQPDNTNSASNAQLTLQTGGSSGGSPFNYYLIASDIDWSSGVDNVDNNYKIGTGQGFTGGASPKLTIATTGSVGIATTTPSTAGKLSVAGGVTIGVATTDTALNAHQLRINNAAAYSEIDAGETAFAITSDESMKDHITPVNTDSIYALVRAMNYPRKWQYKTSVMRSQSEIDRINEATSDNVVSTLVTAKVDSLIKAKATGTFTVNTTQVPYVGYKKAIQTIKPEHVEVGLASMDVATLIPADTTWKDIPETTYVARYDTIYTCSDSKRTQIQNVVLASQQVKATSELAAYEVRIAKDAARPHVSVMAQDMYPVSRLMKGAAAKETTLSGDDLINALLIAVKKQDERITQLEKRVSELETR